MWKTILRRILVMIPQVIILSILIFILAKFMPGDPFSGLIDPKISPAAIEEMRRKGRTEAEIAEATAYNDTDDEYILELRKEYRDLNKKFKEEIEGEKTRWS